MRILYLIILYAFSRLIKSKSNKKNLIIGAFKKYNWEQLKPFFISLYKSNFRKCDCAMFVQDISQRTKDILETIGVYIYEIPEKYRKMKINNVRYKLYEEYLQNKIDSYNMVLHVDVRDTFFQKDIFRLYKNKRSFIGFSLENGKINEKTNSIWMKAQYGEKIYEEIKGKKIICSGTIWGTIDKFYEFTKNIWNQILLKSPYNFRVHDQTATNYLIYHKNMFNDCMVFSDNDNGPIMTVDLDKNKSFSFDSKDNLLSFKGKDNVCIVHQYDRIDKIVKIVRKKFITKTDEILKLSNLTTLNQTDKIILEKFFFHKHYKISFIFIFNIVIFIFSIILKISKKEFFFILKKNNIKTKYSYNSCK